MNLKEPVINSISNLSYAAAAILLHVYLGTTWWTSIVSVGLLVLAVGSSMFHFQRRPDGTKSVGGGHADEAGMYLTFLPLMSWSIYAVDGAHEWIWIGHAIALGLLASIMVARADSYTLLAVVAGVSLPIMVLLDAGLGALIIGVLVCAFLVRGSGKPAGYDWPHAIWHVLTAIAVFLAAYLLTTNT